MNKLYNKLSNHTFEKSPSNWDRMAILLDESEAKIIPWYRRYTRWLSVLALLIVGLLSWDLVFQNDQREMNVKSQEDLRPAANGLASTEFSKEDVLDNTIHSDDMSNSVSSTQIDELESIGPEHSRNPLSSSIQESKFDSKTPQIINQTQTTDSQNKMFEANSSPIHTLNATARSNEQKLNKLNNLYAEGSLSSTILQASETSDVATKAFIPKVQRNTEEEVFSLNSPDSIFNSQYKNNVRKALGFEAIPSISSSLFADDRSLADALKLDQSSSINWNFRPYLLLEMAITNDITSFDEVNNRLKANTDLTSLSYGIAIGFDFLKFSNLEFSYLRKETSFGFFEPEFGTGTSSNVYNSHQFGLRSRLIELRWFDKLSLQGFLGAKYVFTDLLVGPSVDGQNINGSGSTSFGDNTFNYSYSDDVIKKNYFLYEYGFNLQMDLTSRLGLGYRHIRVRGTSKVFRYDLKYWLNNDPNTFTELKTDGSYNHNSLYLKYQF